METLMTFAAQMEVQRIMSEFPYMAHLEQLRHRVSTAVEQHIRASTGGEQQAAIAIIGVIELFGSISDKMYLEQSWRSHLQAQPDNNQPFLGFQRSAASLSTSRPPAAGKVTVVYPRKKQL